MSLFSSGSDLGHQDVLIQVSDSSQVGEARRAAVTLAGKLGFDETDAGKVALIVTEATNNIVKHGGGGNLIVRALYKQDNVGLEFVALDRGSGMADPDRCLRDGFSTAGTMGTGLGAIRRLSSFLDLYSGAQAGTVLLARLWAGKELPGSSPIDVGALCLAKAGEPVSGDGWAVEQRGNQTIVLVGDGLGHGEFAAVAARAAIRLLRSQTASDPVTLVKGIHEGLRGTRGAAIAVACVDFNSRQIRYVGVGNISAAIIAGTGSQRMVSHNGTAGAEARKIQEFVYAFPVGALLVMHSDGIATHWSLDHYPGLVRRDPALIAGVLYRDFVRGRDDATVLALRETAS